MLPIIYTEFVRTGKMSYERFIDVMVNNPAKVFNLPQRSISVGSVADIAVIDIENKHIYEEDEILSMGKNTPFIGFEYYGYTRYTFVNGKLAYKC